jgi:transposase
MHIIGFDLGKRKSQVCVGNIDGSVVLEKRVSTERSVLSELLTPLLPARVLIESSTGAEWVARHLESLGAEVIVADPRFGPMYAQLDKRIKTDKRDSRALMHALRLQAYQPVRRRSDANRDLRGRMLVRNNLVRARSRIAVQIRSLLEIQGIVLAPGRVEDLSQRIQQVTMPEPVGLTLLPLVLHLQVLRACFVTS